MKKIAMLSAVLALLCGIAFAISSCSGSDPKNELYRELTENYVEPEGYTSASYADFDAAYKNAREIYEKENATALEIDKAIDNLKKAKHALVRTADFSQLKLAIAAHESIDPSMYTTESYQTYLAAYNKALEVYSVDSSKQSEINSAVTSLNNAIKALVRIPDSLSLQRLLQTHISEADYTTSSYAVYEEAYTNALKLIQSGTTSKNDLLLAENLLNQAIAGLVYKADTTELLVVCTRVENKYLQIDASGRTPEARYSSDSYSGIMTAVNSAKEAIATGDVSAEDVSELIKELNDAVAALVDLSELLDRIDFLDIYAQQSSHYTEESYAAFMKAISSGITVATSSGITKEQVAQAVSAIDGAIGQLVRRELTADGKRNKALANRLIRVGASQIFLADYMNDFVSFFTQVTLENPSYAFYTVGDIGYFTNGNVEITMGDGYLKMEYKGKSPVSQEDSDTASFAGVTFDMSEFDVSMQDNLGTPSEYSKRTETEFGQERTIAVLTYENEIEGLCVVLEYDTIDNYILSIEISKTNSASVS